MPKINLDQLSPSPLPFEYARKIHFKFVYFSNLKKKWLDCYSEFSAVFSIANVRHFFYSIWFLFDFPSLGSLSKSENPFRIILI